MKRPVSVLIALVVMAAMVVALATPTLANDHFRVFDFDNHDDDFCDRFDLDEEECEDLFNDEDCFLVDGVLIGDCDDDFDRDRFDRDFDGDFDQDVEQETESGDVDQSIEVSGTGDNSNQCVGVQGAANTGNTQTTGSFGLLGGDFDDFDVDDSGADIDESGSSDTSCDQQVNQAASASG